jgi:CubicO group peptidase (beta-lactamase class C family)
MSIIFRRLLLMTLCYNLLLPVLAQEINVQKKLGNFDQYIEKTLKEWNAPGIGVGIIAKNRLVFAKGYGYRDYEKKLPITSNTLFQIASNTKLFTTMAAGLLVAEGKLDWDKPVRQFVPSIQFSTEELNNTVTIRDMLAHRTGISRHDMIWYKSDFSRKELFDRLKYLEPSQPIRQGFLYNNMMYAASGYVVEYLTKQTWEDFLRERIFKPLDMSNTLFSIEEMTKQADCFVPYNEKRDTTILYRIPYYEEAQGIGPAGSIISNINDISKWLIALMNEGSYKGKQVIPADVVRATLAPSIALPNSQLENRGFNEILNPVYGMGRQIASYRGHYLAFHGGDLDGIHSQISCMPYDSIGVIVFVIGDHNRPLRDIISYNVYERLLGMSETPWSERRLKDRTDARKLDKEGRKKSGGERIANTIPSHSLGNYIGEYEHPAYGVLKISMKDSALLFDFHKIVLPLNHYHYDRFDTPNDEQYGLWSVNFKTNPQGEISQAVMSLDESEASFVRKPDASLNDPKVLQPYIGKYEYGGSTIEVMLKSGNFLYLLVPGQPAYQLFPYKPRKFRIQAFSDFTFNFTIEDGKVVSMKQIDPSGEYVFKKKIDH